MLLCVRLKLLIPFNAVLITQDEEYWICVQMGVRKMNVFQNGYPKYKKKREKYEIEHEVRHKIALVTHK